MTAYQALLSPIKIKHLELKNRVVSAAHAPGYAQDGKPGLRYQLYHEEKAKGGLALTMFGGSSNIARDSGSIYGQIYVGADSIVPVFKEFSQRIHKHGCALMCQITHMGRRTSWSSGDWLPTVGPSVIRDPAHHSVPREATVRDIRRIVRAFGDAAVRCREGGLDGCEILSSVHLLGQFLSPLSNRRADVYGGALENRSRFLFEVLDEVRERVGDEFIVSVRYTADESNEGGMTAEEGVALAKMLGEHGGCDLLNVNGAYGGTTRGMAEVFPGMAAKSAPFVELARRVRVASGLPVMQASRLSDPATANYAVESGCLDLAGLVRPHFADPHIVRKLSSGEAERIRPCVGAGYCLDRVYGGGDALCLHNAATGREQSMPHQISPATVRKRIVIVGGGPAGMEAARVSASRGHEVTLFEANNRLGGQILLAARAGWRKDMIGIAEWLAAEIERLGVDIRTGTYADGDDVLAEQPDVVLVASGGMPNVDLPAQAADLVDNAWDLLAGQVRPGDDILIFDEAGGHAACSLADWLTQGRARVELVTPDRHVGRALGGQNYPIYLRNLYAHAATLTPDHRLLGVRRKGNRLVASLRNDYSRVVVEREVDQIVVEQGTVPVDEVYQALVGRSRNLGELDVEALAAGEIQPESANASGDYQLFRIGDAVAGRDIHAAIYDALRLCIRI